VASSEYEGALEIVGAIQSAGSEIAQVLNDMQGQMEPRRDRFAAYLFAELAAEAMRSRIKLVGDGVKDGKQLAAHAWELADMLDAADPKKKP
jgi:hypothetical protein